MSISFEDRALQSNERILDALALQLRSSVGVIPFLGAGISAEFGYLQWAAFIKSIADTELSQTDRAEVQADLDGGNYEMAAARVSAAMGCDNFQLFISEAFSDAKLDGVDFGKKSLSLIPALTSGPVITTNFDRVIEHVFERAAAPFIERVYGANPDEVVPSIQQNRRVLWKIHGDRADRRTRVFRKEEYDTHYEALPGLLQLAFTNRPALFIGCSLRTDRTVQVLIDLKKVYGGIWHYSFQELPAALDVFEERVKSFRAMGVRPVWYPHGKHAEIGRLLQDLVQRVSSLHLPTAGTVVSPPAPNAGARAAQAHLELRREIAEIPLDKRCPPDVPGRDMPPYTPILIKLLRGEIAWFLGAGACLGRLPQGAAFYEHLESTFSPGSAGAVDSYRQIEPSRITQHLADKYGREALYDEVHRYLSSSPPEPTAVHWLVATLRARLREKNFNPAPTLIVTTNYDDSMERALDAAGEPYHLFSYRAGGAYFGNFIYRGPSGKVCLVDRPALFSQLEDDGIVLLKLQGGLSPGVDLPVSYAFMYRDFIELAARIPGSVPRVLLQRLRASSLLFLGSGLQHPSIELLVRSVAGKSGSQTAWAVQADPRPEWRAYWRELGLELIGVGLEQFVNEIDQRVEALAPRLP